MEKNKKNSEIALENAIAGAIQIPGVKVDRNKFLAETFSNESELLREIWDKGPIEAGVSQEKLYNMASNLILKRTSQSSIASFVAGIPGGLAMAATIPADVLQFFGMALRLAQELSYIYGADDLWKNGQVDDEKVRNQLVLYCGVMFGVSGAVSGVRVLSAQIAKTALRKIPQKALTKTFWYPILKKICKAIGVTMTKKVIAKSAEKVIPVIGGVISGALNFASMMPMAKRLHTAFDEASFGYTDEEFEKDIEIIENLDEETETEEAEEQKGFKEKINATGQKVSEGISNIFNKKKSSEDSFEKIKKLAQLKEQGIITEEEFEKKKTELLKEI